MLFKDQVYQFTPATVPNTAKTVIQDLMLLVLDTL